MHYTLFLLLIFCFPNPEAHDFHVSKCLIEYNEKQKTLQLSLHLFIDDLEEGLRRRGYKDLYLCTKQEFSEADSLIQNYLRNRMTFIVNDKSRSFNYIGKEMSDDLAGMWCYLEIPDVTSLETLTVVNRLLLEVYEDQKNILSVIGPDHNATLLFQKGQEQKTVHF